MTIYPVFKGMKPRIYHRHRRPLYCFLFFTFLPAKRSEVAVNVPSNKYREQWAQCLLNQTWPWVRKLEKLIRFSGRNSPNRNWWQILKAQWVCLTLKEHHEVRKRSYAFHMPNISMQVWGFLMIFGVYIAICGHTQMMLRIKHLKLGYQDSAWVSYSEVLGEWASQPLTEINPFCCQLTKITTVTNFTTIESLWIQTLSEKVLKPPNYSKLYPKHFLRRYLDP